MLAWCSVARLWRVTTNLIILSPWFTPAPAPPPQTAVVRVLVLPSTHVPARPRTTLLHTSNLWLVGVSEPCWQGLPPNALVDAVKVGATAPGSRHDRVRIHFDPVMTDRTPVLLKNPSDTTTFRFRAWQWEQWRRARSELCPPAFGNRNGVRNVQGMVQTLHTHLNVWSADRDCTHVVFLPLPIFLVDSVLQRADVTLVAPTLQLQDGRCHSVDMAQYVYLLVPVEEKRT